MDMEQTLEAIRTFQEAWAAFTQSILDTAKALSEMLDAIFSDPKLYPERNGTPPKNTGCRFVSVHTRLSPTTTTSR